MPLPEKACNIGNDADGRFNLGLIYQKLNQPKKAEKPMEKACSGGVKVACKNSGVND